MQFFAGAGRGHIENAPIFLRFAVAIDAIDPLFGCAALGAFGLQGCDEEFGDLSGFVRLGESAFQPGEHLAFAAFGPGLQVGDDDHLELQAFGFMDGHQLHAAVAAGLGVGQCGEFVEGCVERRAEQILLAVGKAV